MEENDMPIEFTIHPVPSEQGSETSFFLDPEFYMPALREFETLGISGLVVDNAGDALSNLDISATMGGASGLNMIVTHGPGIVGPTVAATQLARLDRTLGGRLALRVGAASDSRLDHEAACRRADEYLKLLMQLWSNQRPLDHEGEFYSVRTGFVPTKGPQGNAIPIRMQGRTGTAIQVAARHATIFELAPGSPDSVARQVERVLAAATIYGRANAIRFSYPLLRGDLVKAVQSPGGTVAAKIALDLLAYVKAGVTEFMVMGLVSQPLLRLLTAEVALLLRNSMAHDPEISSRVMTLGTETCLSKQEG